MTPIPQRLSARPFVGRGPVCQIVLEMNPRHAAAALALVGWYLMMPPVLKNGERDYRAPLSQWDLQWSYDSAAQCQKASLLRYALRQENGKVVSGYIWSAKCIATDDPRLAK